MRIRELLRRVTGSRVKSTTYSTLGKVGGVTYVAERRDGRNVSALIMITEPDWSEVSFAPVVTEPCLDISMMTWMRYSAPLTTSLIHLSGV